MTDNLPGSIEWRRDYAPVPYRDALAEQEARNRAIAAGEAKELVWLLEHPPVYTAGTSAVAAKLLDPRFEAVIRTQPLSDTGEQRVIQCQDPATGYTDQMMVIGPADQRIDNTRLPHISLRDVTEIFKPLEHAINGGRIDRMRWRVDLLLNIVNRLVGVSTANRVDHKAARQRDTLTSCLNRFYDICHPILCLS